MPLLFKMITPQQRSSVTQLTKKEFVTAVQRKFLHAISLCWFPFEIVCKMQVVQLCYRLFAKCKTQLFCYGVVIFKISGTWRELTTIAITRTIFTKLESFSIDWRGCEVLCSCATFVFCLFWKFKFFFAYSVWTSL